MEKIRTIKGDIRKEALGWCQCHEHLFVQEGPSRRMNAALYMDDEGKSTAECLQYKQAGGSALVDCQPGGFGRSSEKLLQTAENTGVHIVSVTGYHKLMFAEHLDEWEKASDDALARRFISEVETEITDRGKKVEARAGVIKCVLDKDNQSRHLYKKLFEAVCHAAHGTQAPVLVHVDPETDVLSMIDAFVARRIKPNKLIFCHLDRARYDMGYHTAVLETGAYLEYDTIERLKYHSNEYEVRLIQKMIEAGFEKQLLLSMDPTNQRLKAYGGLVGLDYILTEFCELLNENGISKETVNTMMIENAARALAF